MLISRSIVAGSRRVIQGKATIYLISSFLSSSSFSSNSRNAGVMKREVMKHRNERFCFQRVRGHAALRHPPVSIILYRRRSALPNLLEILVLSFPHDMCSIPQIALLSVTPSPPKPESKPPPDARTLHLKEHRASNFDKWMLAHFKKYPKGEVPDYVT